MSEFPVPDNINDLRSFFGLVNNCFLQIQKKCQNVCNLSELYLVQETNELILIVAFAGDRTFSTYLSVLRNLCNL